MNKLIPIHAVRFVVLIIFQVLICNHINFMGYINPYIYILFIAFFSIKNNRGLFLFLSFMLGLIVDSFSDSGGIHAAAALTIAYAKPAALKFAFGAMYEHHNIRFNTAELGAKAMYIALLAFIHHLVLFSLEVFSISRIILILQKTVFSGIFTILMCLILFIIFSRDTK